MTVCGCGITRKEEDAARVAIERKRTRVVRGQPIPFVDCGPTRWLGRGSDYQLVVASVRCGAVRRGAVRRGAVRCGAVRCGAARCGAVRCGAVRCGVAWRARCHCPIA